MHGLLDHISVTIGYMRIIVLLGPDLKTHVCIITVYLQNIETICIEIYIKGNFF